MNLVVLGSTGSIGVQTLAIAENLHIPVTALSAHRNYKLLAEQARKFSVKTVAIADKRCYNDLKLLLSDTATKVLAGEHAVAGLAAEENVTVLNAVVGLAGLIPTITALTAGNTLALANKESLVAGGDIVMALSASKRAEILPVDSEHSAIFQCLAGQYNNKPRRIWLTASGGAFWGYDKNRLETVTIDDALRHPNWSMGKKITVDSATLMNKGLELIEAMHLFGVAEEDITVVVHRQSVVHSAVEFADGSVIAQMGTPDMRLPIQYALTFPERLPCPAPRLSLFEAKSLTFEELDTDTFPAIKLARQAVRVGGTASAILNGANEQANALFLAGKLRFRDITELVEKALSSVPAVKTAPSLAEIFEADNAAREFIIQNS